LKLYKGIFNFFYLYEWKILFGFQSVIQSEKTKNKKFFFQQIKLDIRPPLLITEVAVSE